MSLGTSVDLSRIESKILKENYLVLLGFPSTQGRGYVPLRVIGREFYYYEYDPLQEGQISAKVAAGAGVNGISDLGFVAPSRLGSTFLTGKPYNVFYVKDYDQIYQLFMGVAPSALRTYLEAPSSTGQRNLDIDRWAQNRLEFGYVDGYDSPLLHPSPNSEIVVPPEFDFSLGYGNPLPTPVNPLLMFVVNRLQVAVVQDPDLVQRMIDGRVPVAIKTVGGLATYTYPAQKVYSVAPIELGSPIDVIEAALGSSPPPAKVQRQGPPSPPERRRPPVEQIFPGVFG
jgi:hypothetical protein